MHFRVLVICLFWLFTVLYPYDLIYHVRYIVLALFQLQMNVGNIRWGLMNSEVISGNNFQITHFY